jgi:hypothetical protein
MEQDQTKLIIIIIVIALAVLIAGWFFTRDGSLGTGKNSIIGEEVDVDLNLPQETITAKHQFANGKHIVAGEVGLPTPCHILDWTVAIAESFPEQVFIDLMSSTQAEACAQVITPARFKVEFTASENARISMTLNGEPVTLNLIDADPGEDLEKFELFIKG